MSSTTMRVQIGCGAGTKSFRRNAASVLRGSTPTRPFVCARRTRVRSPLVTQAIFKRGKQAAEEEDEGEEIDAPDTKTKFLGGLFGSNKSGTQRLKAGQQAEAEETPTRRSRLAPKAASKSAPQSAAPKSGGFLQTARIGRKEQNTVFVAGATGRLGLRIVRELLLAGFKVRAGARDTEKAESYASVATNLGLLPSDAAKRLQVVPVDLEDPDSISAAIGNATRVVQAIGAAENNVLDFGAPKRIDGQAAIDLVDASVEKGITQYIMVTSLGTGKFGWPASVLNLFGGILTQKRRAEKALENSGLNYTIVRPGGMEKPGDDYKKTNNVRLGTADKLFGGQVSRLQVAELIASAVANPEVAGGKILEVVAEPNAPKLDYETLLQNYGTSGVAQEEAVEEEEAAVPETPPKAAARPARPAPRQKRQRTPSSAPPSLSGDQEGIAEGIAQKEIDQKLKKDAPEPSKESKGLAEDIAKAEINIDSGKEKPTKSWFGLGGKSKESSPEATASGSQTEVASSSSQGSSDPVTTAKGALDSAKAFVTKEPQSPEDVDRLRDARNKSAETRAKQEAEFLARLESQRQEEARKKKSELEKREKEALEKSRKERDALFAKQEKEAEEYRKIQARQKEAAQAEREARAKALAEAQKADAEKAEAEKKKANQKAAPVAQKSAEPAADPKQQAANNAIEARQWIDEWRSSQGISTSSAASNGSKPDAAASKSEPSNSSEGSQTTSAAKEARQWIDDWRSRTGAKV